MPLLGEFQSTLPARGATRMSLIFSTIGIFQSTLPARGATVQTVIIILLCFGFQSTLPARGATRPNWCNWQILPISIHAPREGSDTGVGHLPYIAGHFNPRSPRGERLAVKTAIDNNDNFNPRSPRGERHVAIGDRGWGRPISIHAPREGSDGTVCRGMDHMQYFNPRSPRGERRRPRCHGDRQMKISIHAPREGSDFAIISAIN